MNDKIIQSQDLIIGMAVEINPQSDQSRTQRVEGEICEILTKNKDHPHGMLVKLKTGEKGRVKRILAQTLDKSQTMTGDAHPSPVNKFVLKSVIDEGENHTIEFKANALWSSKYTQEDIKKHRPQSKELHVFGQNTSKIIIAKTLAAFLNSDGGTLIIGVKEDKVKHTDEVIGIELEYPALKDSSIDGYRRMIVDLIKDYFPSGFFNQLNKYFHISFENINELTVCGIKAEKSDKKVFLKLNGKDHFYIRTDASTREITGEAIVDYCDDRFR